MTTASILRPTLVVAIVALVPAVAAAYTTGAGLAGTPHDFSGKTVGSITTGSCTFCHTPHKALATLLLWNHKLSTNNFSWDATKTTAGTSYPTFKGDTYKGPSAKCLSCHDGSVAIGDVNWFNAGNPGVIDSTKITGARQIATATGSMAGNHPVAMPFPYGGAASTYNSNTTGPAAYLDEWVATPETNLIRLFNDDGAGNISAGPIATKTGIECSSCHDPHNRKVADQLFLRGKLSGNTASGADAYICFRCHTK